MRIKKEAELDFDDVLLLPQRTKTASRFQVGLEREFKFYNSPRTWWGIPIMISNMDTTGCFRIAEKLIPYHIITVLHKFYSAQQISDFFRNYIIKHNNYSVVNYVWVSIGMKDDDLQRAIEIQNNLSKYQVFINIVVDIANGYTEEYVHYLSKVRKEFPTSIICAGNICTEEMVPEYILHGGVDIVKVGIGPGSVCTTRVKTGVGRPQLSAISNCAYKAHGLNSDKHRLGLICGDGGCKTSGDVCKAFAGNADFVMLGGMIAGAEECEGEWTIKDGEKYKYIDEVNRKRYSIGENQYIEYNRDNTLLVTTFDETKNNSWRKHPTKVALKFHGMSSKEAMEQHHGGMASYKTAEGKEVLIPNKGPVVNIIEDILGGLRSCCSYLGAQSIKEISRCAEFVQVNRTHNTVYE